MRDIVRGDKVRIHSQGCVKTIIVDTAHNYGTASDPIWYIEGTEVGGGAVYWKQDYDGGRVVIL